MTSESMRKSSYHSKTLFHRNQAQARLWFARLLFKNKRNNKHFNTVIIFLNEHLLEAVNQKCSATNLFSKFHKIYSKNLYWKKDSVTGVWILWNF